ncbi:MAG: DUF2791 family P-loop domain-containing protein, partial [Spirochaetes bacterium]|nr:DUF2791 family P-loop domain-containing protein [Spirochaetota bacterium]
MTFQIKKNEIIQNKYRILEKLGEGGMSVVYTAEDTAKKTRFAIKILKPGITSSYVEDVIRFKKEVALVSKFDHPGVIRFYETGDYNNAPYLVTELTKGESLSVYLQKHKFSIDESVDVISQLVEALSYVHGKGVVHRDIKPGNIIINKEKNKYKVKLLDFGLSLVMELSQIKGEEEVVGTFGYMSPEATGIVKKTIDERSDLYSLGIVFYNLLTGELPFKAKDTGALLHQQVAVEAPALHKVKPNIPAILNEIVMKLLFKDPELRYQSARGLLHDIQRYRKGEKEFIIGQQDQKVKLTYQTRLVGREEEVGKIKELFNNVKQGEGSICLIGGEPGVGKTRLVEAIQEYAYEQGYAVGGLFIRGRCLNQENKIPYQPIRDALNEYVKKIERLDKKEKQKEQERLNKILGELGDIIIRLNPNIEQILGEVPDLVPLEPERENQRFLMVVSKFLFNLTQKNKTCIIFLDDLQWADEGSLRLLEELSQSIKKSNLFILGTYRNNEVDEFHSLKKIIRMANEKKYRLVDIQLTPFTIERLNRMVSGILGEKEERSKKLAEYILEKSGGNPFFAITILRELVEQKTMEWKAGYWVEDWAKIKKIQISANIVDMILTRIKDLPNDIDDLLRIGSLIGKAFEMDLLYKLIKTDEEDIVRRVDDAIERQLLERSIVEKGKVIFIHDRIKEAFLAKIDKKMEKEFHLKIAEVIEEKHKGNEEEVIFDLAHHYIEGGNKKKGLEYGLRAAEKAKENYANDEAISYFKIVMELLKFKGNQDKEKLLKVKEDLIDVYLTVGNLDEAINISKAILPLKKKGKEKAIIYRNIGVAFFKKGDWKRCETNLINGLKLLNETVPRTNIGFIFSILKSFIFHSFHILFSGVYLKKKRKNVHEEDLEKIWIYRTLGWMYILSDIPKFIWSILRIVDNTESRIGRSKELGMAYSAYGSVLMAIPLFDRSIKYFNKAVMLHKEFNDIWVTGQTMQFMGYCYTWKADTEKGIKYFSKAKEIFEKIGDLWELGMVEHGLGDVYVYSSDYKRSMEAFTHKKKIAGALKDGYGISGAYSESGHNYVELGDFQNAEHEMQMAYNISKAGRIWFIYCANLMYWGYMELERGNLNKAKKMFEEAIKLDQENIFIKNYVSGLYPYYAESLISIYVKEGNSLNKKEKHRRLKLLKNACRVAVKKTKQWPNYSGAGLLAMAKYYALIKQYSNAVRFFKKSISLNKKAHRKYRAGRSLYEYSLFLNSIVKKEKAKSKLEEACKIFMEIESKEYIKRCRKLLGIEETGDDLGAVTQQDRLQLERRMTTVLNTSRYLSSILDLDELLEKIMDRTIELVGAERGLLLLYPDKDEGKPMELETKVLRGVKSDESSTFTMSKSILKKVIESRKPLIIDDASTDAALKAQASIVGKGFKSVLCAPIVTKNELLGVIYLDNHLVSGLFKEEDLRILELISSQAGVSIENARLYKKSIVKERIEQDMEIAGTIQKLFLPEKIEVIKKLAIDAYYSPAEFIGGDYYDVIKIDKDRYAIILVDISGHGSSAAIV